WLADRLTVLARWLRPSPVPSLPPPRPDELEPMIKHINFELEVLATSTSRVLAFSGDKVYADRIETAADGDAALVTLRNVIAFFENNRGKPPTGMNAKDYTRTRWRPKRDGGGALAALAACHGQISERVAHISVQRHRDSAPLLPYADIRDRVD